MSKTHDLVLFSATIITSNATENPSEDEVYVTEYVERRREGQPIGEVDHQDVSLKLPNVIRLSLELRGGGGEQCVQQSHQNQFQKYEVL